LALAWSIISSSPNTVTFEGIEGRNRFFLMRNEDFMRSINDKNLDVPSFDAFYTYYSQLLQNGKKR